MSDPELCTSCRREVTAENRVTEVLEGLTYVFDHPACRDYLVREAKAGGGR